MFDKYHLIHFEIKKPLTSDPNGLIYLAEGTSFPDVTTIRWGEFAGAGEDSRFSLYRWTGSFDMLLSTASHRDSIDSLYLQGFVVMDNTGESFIKRSRYNSLLVSYTYAGEGTLIYDDQTYHLKEGSVFVIDCRRPHEYRAEGNWKHADIHMWGANADSLCGHFAHQNIVHLSYSQTSFHTMLKKLLDACTIVSDHGNLFISNALTNLLCSLLDHAEKEGKSSIPETYKYVIHYMENNYMHPLSLDSLSAFANISKSHFAREFKKYTGSSPNDYLLQLRIKHACLLLAASDLSIEQITNDVGIHNMSNFIKQFKKRTGMTPSAFRNLQKNEL